RGTRLGLVDDRCARQFLRELAARLLGFCRRWLVCGRIGRCLYGWGGARGFLVLAGAGWFVAVSVVVGMAGAAASPLASASALAASSSSSLNSSCTISRSMRSDELTYFWRLSRAS